MNVGYTPERALDLASRLRRTSADLDEATAVVECSRRVATHPTDAELARLVDALLEFDRSREIVRKHRSNGGLRRPAAPEGTTAPAPIGLQTRTELHLTPQSA